MGKKPREEGLSFSFEYSGDVPGRYFLLIMVGMAFPPLLVPALLFLTAGALVWWWNHKRPKSLTSAQHLEALEAESQRLDQEIHPDPLSEKFAALEASLVPKIPQIPPLPRASVPKPRRQRGSSRHIRRFVSMDTRGLTGIIREIEVTGVLHCAIQVDPQIQRELVVRGPEHMLRRVETLVMDGVLIIQGRDLSAEDRVQVAVIVPSLRKLTTRGKADVMLMRQKNPAGNLLMDVFVRGQSKFKPWGNSPMRIAVSGSAVVDLIEQQANVEVFEQRGNGEVRM